jgi:hypothetical protein
MIFAAPATEVEGLTDLGFFVMILAIGDMAPSL